MKSSKWVFLVVIASGLILVGQQYTEYTAGMKVADGAWKVLQKLDTKTGKEAVGSAERLGGVFEEMIAFWRQREARDAVKYSEQGKAAAAELATAAHSGDAAQAEATFKTLSETCRSCHEAHREKLPDGKFRIK